MCDTRQLTNGHIVAFLSLEDFAQDVIPVDNLVRVESITRTLHSKVMPGGLIQWLVIVTAQMNDGMAMTSIKTGETWKVAARDEPYHDDNTDRAVNLVRQYLEAQSFAVGKGILNPGAIMDNIVGASTNLWRFEGKRLAPNDNELATAPALAGADHPTGDRPSVTNLV